jgi:hypothetical protein
MLSAVTNEWQHNDCWRASVQAVPPETSPDKSKRDSR